MSFQFLFFACVVMLSKICAISTQTMKMQILNDKLLNSIPLGSFLSASKSSITKNTQTTIESLWLNVNVEKQEQSWRFKNLIGFLPQKLLALHRWKLWWMIPKLIHDKNLDGAIPPETSILLGKISDNEYLVIIPAIDKNMVFSLEGSLSMNATDPNVQPVLVLHGIDNSHNFTVIPSDSLHTHKGALFTKGSNLFLTIQHAVNTMKSHVRQSHLAHLTQLNHFQSPLSASLNNQQQNQNQIYNKKNRIVRGPGPSFVDYFGWCTWDSFYTDMSSKRLLNGLDSFTKLGVTPRFVILDDGWQSTNVDTKMNGEQWTGRLKSFQANFKFHSEYKHPDDELDDEITVVNTLEQTCMNETSSLEGLIKRVKSDKGIHYFLVWQ